MCFPACLVVSVVSINLKITIDFRNPRYEIFINKFVDKVKNNPLYEIFLKNNNKPPQ